MTKTSKTQTPNFFIPERVDPRVLAPENNSKAQNHSLSQAKPLSSSETY